MKNLYPPEKEGAEIHTIGEDQGYALVHVRLEPVIDGATNKETIRMTTYWEPTQEEITRIAMGAPIRLEYLNVFPPTIIDVEPVPEITKQ